MRSRFASVTALLTLSAAVYAQPSHPRGSATTTIGGKKVTIDYGRPVLQGRTIDDMQKKLAADRMWRAGENQVTILTTEGDILIGGKKVPAGKYSLYVHAPEIGAWSIAVNTDTGVPLGQIYDKASEKMKNEPWPHIDDYQKAIGAKEVARAPMKSATVATPAESFTINFAPAGDGATMTLAWGDRSWSVEIKPAR